jgi:hypothetical protein
MTRRNGTQPNLNSPASSAPVPNHPISDVVFEKILPGESSGEVDQQGRFTHHPLDLSSRFQAPPES